MSIWEWDRYATDGNIELCVKFLNSLLVIDPVAINKLCNFRVSCNDNLAEHSRAVVTTENTVGVLGLLNAVLDPNDKFRIAAVVDEQDNILHFQVNAMAE